MTYLRNMFLTLMTAHTWLLFRLGELFLSVRSTRAILNIEVQRNLLTSAPRAIAAALRAVACILGVAMLLSFPSARAHLFSQHFGTTEIRQNIVRHTFVAGPEAGGVEEIAHVDAQATIPAPVTIENVAKRLFLPACCFSRSYFPYPPTFEARAFALGRARPAALALYLVRRDSVAGVYFRTGRD